MTNTQWPTMPLPEHAQDGPPLEPAGPGSRWTVLIEENRGYGDAIRWSGSAANRYWSTRNEARSAAEDAARSYVPSHPMSEQSRASYRVSLDEYLTVVDGATSTFSFRVTVAEVL